MDNMDMYPSASCLNEIITPAVDISTVSTAAVHSDKISHLTYTLLTCLQIIKHNIAYMSAVGAEYAEVRLSLHQCTAATSWAHCPHGAVSPVLALPGPRLKTSI